MRRALRRQSGLAAKPRSGASCQAEDIDEDKIEASFKNGVLKVTLPKSVPAQAKMKRIEINAPTKH
jgi:hypothetical protein